MTGAVDTLLAVARGPSGQPRPVTFDVQAGALAELGAMLSRYNGFFACNAGVQVFRAGEPGTGPELRAWNAPGTWKDTYRGLADGLFCFGQDLFGRQFAVQDRTQVVVFDPETATQTRIGDSLEDWAAWLLADPDLHGARGYATAWQDRFGPLEPGQRLIPLQLFALGGSYDPSNITIKDAATCMRARGPFAQRLHSLPKGTQLSLMADQPPSAPSDDPPVRTELEVFADYNSFVVQDENARFEPDPAWTRALLADLIAIAPGAVGVGTARAMTVPVTVEIRAGDPGQDFEGWDHVTQASLHTTSGRLLVSMFDARRQIPRIPLAPGTYAARVYYGGFRTISADGLDGDDHYRVVLWPGIDQAPEVLKRYPDPVPGG